MRRFLKYTGFTLVLLVVVLIVAVALVVATESGTHFAWTKARAFLPKGLRIDAVEGRLLGPFTVRGLDYRAKNFHLTVGESQLRWTPRDLVTHRTLNLDLIALTGVRYTQLRAAPPAPKKKSAPLNLPQRIDLPLDARLGEFRLRDVEYRPTPNAKPVVLHSAILRASYVGDRLTVGRLAIDAPLLNLNGKARITASNEYPLEGTFDWQGRPPQYAPVTGHTALNGSLRELRLDQTVEAPYSTHARIMVRDPLKRPRFNAELNLKSLALQAIDPKLPPTTLNLALKTAGVPDDLELHAKAAASDAQYGTLNLAFDGGFADQIVTIEKLAASSPERPARLRARGRIAFQGKQPAVDVKARWRQLRWPLSGSPQFASREGRLDVDGSMNAARAKLFAAVSGTALTKAGINKEQKLDADFRGGFIKKTKTLKMDELSVAFADQRFAAQGRVMLAGKQPELDLNSHWQNVRWPLAGKPLVSSPAGAIKLNGTQDNLKAELDTTVGDEGHIQGSAKRAGENVEVALAWRKLRWPLAGTPQVKSAQGTLELNGTVEALRTKLVAALDGPALTGAGITKEQPLEANFSGGFAKKIFNIDKFTLALAEQKTSLTAAGRIALNKKQPAFDLDVGWNRVRWPLAGEAQVESSKGTLKVEGTIEAARAKLNAALGGAALVQAGAGQEQTLAMNFAGGFAQKTKLLTIDELALALAQQRLASHGRVSLQGPKPRFDLRTTWRQLRWPLAAEPMMTSPKGEVTVAGTPQNLQAELNVGVGDEGSIRGRARRMGERINLALGWRKLRWPLEAPQVASPTGTFTVAGLVKDYQAKLTAQIDAPERTDAHISLAGRGSLKSLDLNRIDIEALQGQLTGNAQVAWKPALQASVALDADGMNPGELLAGWPGKLGLTLRAQAGMRDNQPVARFETLKVDGRLRGNPLQLNARGAYDPAGLKLDDFSLVSRDSIVEAEGFVGDTVDVNWRIKSPDLGQLLPEAKGKINGQGSASGPLKRPKVEATLTGAGLRYQTFELQSLDLDADVDAGGESQSHLSLALENGQAGGIALNKIALNGEGDLAAHTFSLTARTSTGDADMDLAGVLEHPWQSDMLWRFQLDKATLKYPQLAAWQLPSPVTGMIDSQRAELSRGCWISGDAKLCLQGGRSPEGMHGQVELKDLAFNYFTRLLPPDARLDGKVSARGEFNQPANGPLAATMHLGTTAGRVASVVTGVDTDTQEAGQAAKPAVSSQASTLLDFRPSAVHFDMGNQGMRLVTALRVADAGGIHIDAGVPEGAQSLTERPLHGRITANVPDLSFIAQLAPDVGRFKGRLEGNMRLVGTLNRPSIFGKLALADSNAVLNGPGLTLNGLRAELTGEGREGIRLDAAARSGGGTLDVGGQIKLAGDDAPRANIRIHGEDFQVVNTADARVSASPDLTVRTRTGRVNVTGEVRVPHASITPKQLPPSAVSVSSDQVIVEPGDKTQTTGGASTKVYARVRLILGNDSSDLSVDLDENNLTDELNKPPVYIDAFGLNAGFTGELLIVDKPGEPTSGSGELQIVDGTYQAYGQDLIIEEGRILFPGGPISEPGLEVTAVRGDLEDQNVRVGVNVRGSLKRPKFELFSEPSMTQQEQLSYLVLGHASGESSGGESSLLARAALALGLKGGNYLAQNVGSKLGLDEIGIESGSDQGEGEQASLVIGKYLSPKLYVSYGIGLLEPISTLKVQYSITKRLQLVTESSGASSGGDVIYTIERGK